MRLYFHLLWNGPKKQMGGQRPRFTEENSYVKSPIKARVEGDGSQKQGTLSNTLTPQVTTLTEGRTEQTHILIWKACVFNRQLETWKSNYSTEGLLVLWTN